MKRYKITLMIPHTQETLAVDEREAAREAERLAKINSTHHKAGKAFIHSVEFMQDEPEPIDFNFNDGDEAA